MALISAWRALRLIAGAAMKRAAKSVCGRGRGPHKVEVNEAVPPGPMMLARGNSVPKGGGAASHLSCKRWVPASIRSPRCVSMPDLRGVPSLPSACRTAHVSNDTTAACTNSNFVVQGTRHISRATSAGGGGGAPDSTFPTRPEAGAESSSGSEPGAGACVSACSCDRMSHRLELARCGTAIGRISSTGAASVAMGVLRTVLGLDHVHDFASCRCQCHGASSGSTYLVFATAS